jgi:hypothetical protein
MNPAQEIAYLQNGAQELETYLLSQELYWALPANLPRLTIGNLLLTQLRQNSPASRASISKIESIRTKWRTNWQNKARREFENRLRLWSNYLQDYTKDAHRYGADYQGEVRLRAILELLLHEIENPPGERAALNGLDATLKAHFQPGDFIWKSELAPAFDPQTYWFLYGTLKS